MTRSDQLIYKKKLFELSVSLLEQRIQLSETIIKDAQLTANEEEKSSAGDKYETSRAMSQNQKEMFSKQLSATKNELASLLSIDFSKLNNTITPGSVIICTAYTFFIGAGLGKIEYEGRTLYLISKRAPLAASLYQKKVNDKLRFNNSDIIIEHIF